MGSRHSSYKKLEEEHEFVPLSNWQKKQEKDEAVAEASSTEQTGQKAEQSERAKVKENGEKK